MLEGGAEDAQNIFSRRLVLGVDLTASLTDEDLQAYRRFAPVALAGKHVRDKDPVPALRKILSLFKILDLEHKEHYIWMTLQYFVDVNSALNGRSVMDVATEILGEEETETMGRFAQWWINEGRTEGQTTGKLEVAMALLAESMPIEKVSYLTGLAMDLIQDHQRTWSKAHSAHPM